MPEQLARAHRCAREAEARKRRQGRQVVLARRLALKAEAAVQHARLAVARVV